MTQLQPAPTRKRTHLYIVLAGALVLGVAWLALNWPSLTTPPATLTHTVVYQADGVGTTEATYTLQSDDGGTRQGDIDLPLMNQAGTEGLSFPGFKTGDFVYLSVQNTMDSGSVTCRILVDGKVVAENQSDGGHVIATCKGRVP